MSSRIAIHQACETKNTEPNKNFSKQKENIEMWEKASEKDLQSGNYEPL